MFKISVSTSRSNICTTKHPYIAVFLVRLIHKDFFLKNVPFSSQYMILSIFIWLESKGSQGELRNSINKIDAYMTWFIKWHYVIYCLQFVKRKTITTLQILISGVFLLSRDKCCTKWTEIKPRSSFSSETQLPLGWEAANADRDNKNKPQRTTGMAKL